MLVSTRSVYNYGCHWKFLLLVGRFLKISSETTWPNMSKFYRKHLWKIFYRISSFHPNWTKTWSPWTILVSDWLKFKKIFFSETRRHNELLLCRNDVWKILYHIRYMSCQSCPPLFLYLFLCSFLADRKLTELMNITWSHVIVHRNFAH